MSGTIEVKLRDIEGFDKAIHFTDWPLDRLDEIIPLINRWGLYTDKHSPGELDFSGTFRYDNGQVFFEVLLHEPDA